MTLLERIEAPLSAQSLDQRLIDTLRTVPGAFGVALAHGPVGSRAILVIDQSSSAFYDAEMAAMEALVTVRREFPSEPIDLLCLSTQDADAFDLPPRMTVYSFA